MRIVKPRIRQPGAGTAAASTDETWSARLAKYIPLSIAGAYPVLDNALIAYAREPITDFGLTPRALDIIVFAALLGFSTLELHNQYRRSGLRGPSRWRVQLVQTGMMIVAFVLWTYSIKGSIWSGSYNAALSVILDVLFLLAANYVPTLTPKEAEASGFTKLNA
jgi:hypothetical protein